MLGLQGLRAVAVAGLLALALGCSGPAAHPRRVLAVRDAATGHVRWSQEVDPEINGVDLLLVDGALMRHGREMVVGQDPRDGHELWSVPGLELPRALLPDLLVLQDSRNAYAPTAATPGSVLTAITPAGRAAWSGPTGGRLVKSRAAVLVVTKSSRRQCVAKRCTTVPPGTGPRRSTVVAMLDPRTGSTRWAVTLPGDTPDATVGATPDVVVAVQSDSATGPQMMFGLSASDGHRLWNRPVEKVSHVIDGDGAIVFQSRESRATRVDPLTGAELWSTDGFTYQFGRPFVGVDRSGNGTRIYRLDPTTGRRLLGQVPFTNSGATTADLLVGADAGQLTAVRGAKQAWTSSLPRGARPSTNVATDGAFVATLSATGFPLPHD